MPEGLNNPVQPAEPAVEDIFSAVDKNIQPVQPAKIDRATVMPKEVISRKISKTTWLLIILGVIAVILLALSGYLYWNKNKASAGNNNSSVLEDQGLVKPPNNNVNKINANLNINKNINISMPLPDYVDTDHDGLSDEAEEKYETNPKKIDSDDDGLSDREEVKVYLTDPNNSDTDHDGYTDGGEVKSGYNPNGPGKLMEK